MQYKPPQLAVLKNLPQELETAYKQEKGNNEQRFHFTSFAKDLFKSQKDIPIDVLVGMYLFEREWIRQENPLATGSRFFRLIDKGLNISPENILRDDEGLVYVFKFYKYIKSLSDSAFITYLGQSKKNFLMKIETALIALKDRETKRIEHLMLNPLLEALKTNIKTMYPDYQIATQSRWFSNSKRIFMLKFIDLIATTCQDLYGGAHMQFATDKEKDLAYSQWFYTLRGLLLFVLLSIKKECWGMHKGEVYKKCLELLGIESLDKISTNDKTDWLRALSTHILNIKKDSLYEQYIKEKCKACGGDLQKIYVQIEEFLLKEERKKIEPCSAVRYFATSVGFIAKGAVSLIFGQLANACALRSIGGAVLGLGGGPIGVVIYGAAGMLLMTQLGRLVRENIIPSTASFIYTAVLDKIGYAITNTTKGVVVYSYEVGQKVYKVVSFPAGQAGLKNIIEHSELSEEDKLFFAEWIKTLLALPKRVMSEAEKDHIRFALGREDEIIDSFEAVQQTDVAEDFVEIDDFDTSMQSLRM